MADEKGWTFDETYSSASEFVADMCESMPVSAVDGSSRPQWLAEGGYLDGDGAAILGAGFPKFCPKWAPALKEAVSGHYDRWFADGTYEVKKSPGPADPDTGEIQIGPGSYRTTGDLDGCYWERTTQGGSIIDNQFATAARKITVTVQAGELFTSRGCGTWKPVK